MGSLAIASLLPVNVPIPPAQTAGEGAAIGASAAAGAPERPELGNAIFAALFGELATAGVDEASGDVAGGEGDWPPDGKVPFGFDVMRPAPQMVRPPMPAGDGERALQVARFLPAAAPREFGLEACAPEDTAPEAHSMPKAEARREAVPFRVAANSGVQVDLPARVPPTVASTVDGVHLPSDGAPGAGIYAALPREAPAGVAVREEPRSEGRRAPKRDVEEADAAEVPSQSGGGVALPPVPAPVPAAVTRADTQGAPNPEELVEVLGPPAPEIGRDAAEAGELRARRSTRPAPRAETVEEVSPLSHPTAGRSVPADAEALPARASVRAIAAGVREKGELAFTARVAPAIPDGPAHLPAKRQKPAVEWPEPSKQQVRPTAPVMPGAARKDSSRERDEAPTPQPERQPVISTSRSQTQFPHADFEAAAARVDTKPDAGVASHDEVRSLREVEPVGSKPAAPAREIRLELAAGEGRVEVKLSEKAGELKVAVRTPDSHLADRLRADLPTLSSRLEERGLRAETWQPSQAAPAELRKTNESAAANNGGPQEDAPGQQGREQQREGEPRRHHAAQEDEQPKEKRKDFEWFLSATQ